MQNPVVVTGCWRGWSQGVESGRGLPHSKTLREFGGKGGAGGASANGAN